MRFNPPRVSLPTELDWLLAAAFAPELPPFNGDPEVVSKLARRFDLGPRIVARHGAAALRRHLGEAAAEPIRAHRRGVAVALAGDRTARRLASLAAIHGLSIVFLKGYALQRMLGGPAGWRPYADLDALLSRPAAEALRALLIADGWASSAEAGNPQHLPAIVAPEGTVVDIHFRLRGVRAGTERWASAGELLAVGLCRSLEGAPGLWVPRPPLMAAHIAVHALEQHGHRPGTYPLLRAVADLIDLLAATGDDRLDDAAWPLIREELEQSDLRSLFKLSRVLAEGRLPDVGRDAEAGAEALLRHVVAGVLDPAYGRSLTIDHTAGRMRQARRDGELMRYISRKLKAPADSMDATAGGSEGGQGSVRRRVLRPIRLAARFTAAAAARLRRGLHR